MLVSLLSFMALDKHLRNQGHDSTIDGEANKRRCCINICASVATDLKAIYSASTEADGKFPTMWAGLALKRGTLPSILSQRIIDRMESRSRSESPHTVFVNSAPIFRGTFGGSLLERISRTGQFGTSVDPRIEWENIE
jgi:hypothetical protein